MRFYQLALIPAVFLMVLQLLKRQINSGYPPLQDKRICLLIAHPDDEAMFFAPTVLALTRPELGNHVQILSLSNGDAEGLGATRHRELVNSALLLGLRDESDVTVLDDARFRDSMTISWDAEQIANLLASRYAHDGAEIDVLVTFDRHGVSSHPNHISLYHGAVAFVRSLVSDHDAHQGAFDSPVKLYTLTTVNVLRKYASLLDALMTMITAVFKQQSTASFPASILSVSGLAAYRVAQRAMTEAHKSQMVWFRWAYIGLSRYMIVNDLVRYDAI